MVRGVTRVRHDLVTKPPPPPMFHCVFHIYMCVCVCVCVSLHTHTHTLYLLYPFICHWTLRLSPCLGYCEQCCCEHRGTCISLISSFVRVYTQDWYCWILWQLYFQFFEKPPYCFPQWLHQFTFSPKVQEGSIFSTPSITFAICRLFNNGHSDQGKVVPYCDFDLHFSN